VENYVLQMILEFPENTTTPSGKILIALVYSQIHCMTGNNTKACCKLVHSTTASADSKTT